MAFMEHFLNFILPPRCINCGKILNNENGLCTECFNQINFISAPYCQRCGLPFTENFKPLKSMLCANCVQDNNKKKHVQLIRSAIQYDDFSKKPILALKFMDKTENAKIFAKWLKISGKDIFENQVDLIVPVPLHYLKLIKRRYNQSALIAKELSNLIDIPYDCSSLIKHKSTKPQEIFSRQQRIVNVKGAFSVCHRENIAGKRIVLIDDVYTTGSTIQECAKALYAAGANSVDALTIARVCL